MGFIMAPTYIGLEMGFLAMTQGLLHLFFTVYMDRPCQRKVTV